MDLPHTQDVFRGEESLKMFLFGFHTKNGIILVVTVAGGRSKVYAQPCKTNKTRFVVDAHV